MLLRCLLEERSGDGQGLACAVVVCGVFFLYTPIYPFFSLLPLFLSTRLFSLFTCDLRNEDGFSCVCIC